MAEPTFVYPVVRFVEPGSGIVAMYATQEDAWQWIARYSNGNQEIARKYAVEEWKVQASRSVVVPGPSGPSDDDESWMPDSVRRSY